MDVKKIGQIPDGGGWRAHGRPAGPTADKMRQPKIGYDYVHSLVDDHSRLAYSEILPDETRHHLRGVPARAADYFAAHAITQIERLITDNAWSLPPLHRRQASSCPTRRHTQVHQAALPLAERQGRALQPHPADRMGLPAGLHQQRRTRRRACPMARLLQHSTPPHRTRRPPAHQPTVTNLMAEYT